MSDRFLLDTNVVIRFLNGEPAVLSRLDDTEDVFLSVVVAAELLYGAEKAARRTGQLARVEAFVSSIAVLPCTLDVARYYGRINLALRTKGKPIPQNDLWIAATALTNGLILATGDRHFAEVDGLETEAW